MAQGFLRAAPASSSSILQGCGVFYALGPVEEASVTERRLSSSVSGSFCVLVPASRVLSEELLAHPDFEAGAAFGYGAGFEEESYTPAQLVNALAGNFWRDLYAGASYAWAAGFTLGMLSAIAEGDRLLALVGMAHFCFLLSLVPNVMGDALLRALGHAACLHKLVLGAYRERIRALKSQGASFAEACRLALCGAWQAV